MVVRRSRGAHHACGSFGVWLRRVEMNAPLQPVFSKVDAIRKEIIAAASLPLNRAMTLPRQAYIDEDYFRVESETVLKTGWLCVAHASQVKEQGNFLALDLLGEPLLILRDKDQTVRVLSRVCVHRAMDIMPEGFEHPRCGKTALLSCPYHRWTYNLDGSLRGCAQMHSAEGFDKKDWGLAELRSAVWNGFVFVNFDGDAPPLDELYGDFGKCIAPWQAQDLEIAIAMEWECDFNWKVMIENWMESYHHLGAHSATLNPFMPGERTWTEPEHPYFAHAHLPFTEVHRFELNSKPSSFPRIAGLSEREQSE